MNTREAQQPDTEVQIADSASRFGQDLPPARANTADFHPGDRVLYVPNHAHGDKTHPDCERGVVSSTNQTYVFVVYQGRFQGQATRPTDLVKLTSAIGTAA
jgi:hypothetical protein